MTAVVAACQTPADIESPDVGAAERAVREAVASGAQLAVLPELAVTGYAFDSVEETAAAAERLDGPTVNRLTALSGELDCAIVCGFCEQGDDGRLYNSAVLVEGGLLRTRYRKVHLWDREADFFTPGDQPPVVADTRVGKVAMMVCYDVEFPEWARLAAEGGADIVAVPCNWPRPAQARSGPAIEVLKVQAVAAMYRLHMVVADRCGSERGVQWVGGSLVCDRAGTLIAGPATPPGAVAARCVLTAELEPEEARDKVLSSRNHALSDRRADLYG